MTAIIRRTNTERICTPDDGSHEPKHVTPCLLLSK